MRWKKLTPYAFLVFPFSLYFIWVILLVFETFFYSFTNWDSISKTFDLIGFANYIELFQDYYFLLSLVNNVKWMIGFVIVSIPAGLSIAMLLDQKFPGHKVYKSLVFLPMTLSFVVIGQIWSWILEPKNGALNTFLRFVGLKDFAKPWLSDPNIVMYSLIAAALWRQIAYAMILFLAGLQGISREHVEAAYVDGANAWQRFWYVIEILGSKTPHFNARIQSRFVN
uniref:Sugar ABC transporter permease n=1 Tax=Fervidobacterium thailandense TaxID=1008305 RepID=A0A7C4GF12_9BACT